jgi:hypothetical protein
MGFHRGSETMTRHPIRKTAESEAIEYARRLRRLYDRENARRAYTKILAELIDSIGKSRRGSI